MTICNDLRKSVLQAAMQGKLTEQLETDTPVSKLLTDIKAEKNRLIAEKKIRKDKHNAFITEDEILTDIPSNWTFLRFGDIVANYDSQREPISKEKRENGVYDYYGATGSIDKVADYIFDGEYLLIGEDGGNFFVPRPNSFIASGKFWANNHVHVVQPLVIDIKYLMHFLNSLNLPAMNLIRGIAVPKLNQQDLNSIITPIPPIEEQKRIVRRIEEIMKHIDELEAIEEELKKLKEAFPVDMKAAVLQAAMQGKLTEQLETDTPVSELLNQISTTTKKKIALTQDDDLPEDWASVKITDIATIYTGNSIAESVKAVKYCGLKEGYDYIGTKDINFDHTICYDNGVRIPFNEPNFRYAEKDATLLCIEGGSAGRKIAILDRKVCFGNKLCSFHPIGIEKKFLYYYLQSPQFLGMFTNSISGIIGGVSINKIKQMNVNIPPIEEQKRIVRRIEEIMIRINELESFEEELKKL